MVTLAPVKIGTINKVFSLWPALMIPTTASEVVNRYRRNFVVVIVVLFLQEEMGSMGKMMTTMMVG